ncbi:MAG TPA: hypothetical protein VFR67_17440 [Pilimelia sp.]|nr:hypothetical protein [Pilimelia sp.]
MSNDEYDAGWFDTDSWDDGSFTEVLAEVMSDVYADADQEELEDALAGVLESLSPAEAFGVTKALGQIGRSAGQIASDPAFAQVAAGVLPVAGGAFGTVVGGPVGTAAGARLGAVAAKSLPKAQLSKAQSLTAPRDGAPKPRAAGGSSAAAQGLVLTQHPDILKGLLALAMGEHGQKSINGVPVARLMGVLSSVFGKAAADADELMYLDVDVDAEDIDVGSWAGDDEAALYTALVDADNAELTEAVRW